MIDCAQIRLELLRHNVRQNHHQDNLPANQLNQARNAAPSPRSPVIFNEDYGPIASAFHNPTRVALFQLTNRTNQQIQMSRFTVTPVSHHHEAPIAAKKPNRQQANRQLHVRVHDEQSEKQSKTESCSGSPSDSIDSGMPNSPAFLTTDDDEDTLSPLPSTQLPLVTSPSTTKNRFSFGATSHAQSNSHPQFRERSASECFDSRQSAPNCQLSSNSNGSTSSLSPNGTPLRSILKKPKILPPGLGNTCVLATNMRRPARYMLARSISECHDDSATLLSSEDLQFVDDEVISMEDLSVVGNGTPLSTCAEVDEETSDSNDSMDEPQKPTAEQQRKKRVSFNEQVQARIYRSSSSILATKNKQDRKLRNRMRRRAESESSDQSFNPQDLVHIPTIPLCKLSAEEKAEEDAPNCEGQNKALTAVDRRDSGFDSNDSGMDSPPEESQKIDEEDEEEMQVETSPKRVQRVISSDSAFGDEIMVE